MPSLYISETESEKPKGWDTKNIDIVYDIICMRLYLYFQNGTLDTDIIIDGFSYVQNYYNNLSHADNFVKCAIPFDIQINNSIKASINTHVKAVITNDDGSNYFSGYLKQDAQFTKESRCDNITLELVSPSFYMDISYDTPEWYVNKTLKECVQILLTKADISSYDVTNLPSKTINVFAIEENDKVIDVMSELLKEYGYTFDFDNNAKFVTYPLFNKPANITQEFRDSVGGNLLGKVTQKVAAKQYDGASVQFDTLEYGENEVIYNDTGDNDIDPNGWLGKGGENGDYFEYSIENKSVKYIQTINSWKISTSMYTITDEHPQIAALHGSIENYGTRGLIKCQNMTSDKLTLNQIKIVGSGYFIIGTGKTKTTDGTNINEVSAKYIFNETDANAYAKNLSDYYRYANFTVSLNSKTDYEYGSFVSVNIQNLGTVSGRIVQKTRKLNSSVISYVIESISAYTPATLQTIYTRFAHTVRNYSNHIVTLYKRSTTEITTTGITANAVYDFTDNTLSWVGGTSNGWTDKLSEVTGDGELYVTSATAYGQNNTDDIEPTEWAEPIAQGMNGINGYNTRTIQLFIRSDAMPTDLPLTFTLDFTQRNISITRTQLNGWQTDFPAINENNDPCWEIHVTALSTETTDVITTSQWSTPAKISQDSQVTKAQIQEMINDSILASAPVVYASTTYGGFYVDNDNVALASQSVTTDITVMQNDRELDFTFGEITLPSGFSATHDGKRLTISVAEGTKVYTGNINIPVIYQAYLSTDTYGDELGDAYADEDGETYGYWILSPDTTVYNLGFGYSQIKGEIYYHGISSIAAIPTDKVIGSYFTWLGADTQSLLCKDGTFRQGAVYKYNGVNWQKDTSPSHMQTALSDILSDASADLETNNSDVVALFRKISTSQAIINELIVTGNALVNKLQALDIYADTFTSYDQKAKGYSEDAFEDAVAQIENETGLSTLTDKTLIQGGKIKTGLINANAIIIGQGQVSGLESALGDINDNLTTKASSQSVTQLSQTVNSQGQSIGTLSQTVTSQGQTITSIDGTVGELNTTVSAQEESLSLLDSTVTTQGQTLSALGGTVTSQGSSIGTLQTTVTSQGESLSNLNTTVSNLPSKTDVTDAKNNAIDSALAQLVGAENVRNQTIIAGGKIKTGLIDAQAIKTEILTADSITADMIDSDSLKSKEGFFDEIQSDYANFNYATIDNSDIAECNIERGIIDNMRATSIIFQSSNIKIISDRNTAYNDLKDKTNDLHLGNFRLSARYISGYNPAPVYVDVDLYANMYAIEYGSQNTIHVRLFSADNVIVEIDSSNRFRLLRDNGTYTPYLQDFTDYRMDTF